MKDETQCFIQHLYRQCPPQSGFITLTAIHPSQKQAAPSEHVSWGNHQRLEKAVKWLDEQNQSGWGTYVAVGLRSADYGRWRRGGLKDVCLLPALFADLDDSTAQTIEAIERFPFAPSMIVNSGKGIHLYWVLETPMQQISVANDLLHKIAGLLKGDTLSAAQSLRLAGTHNTKEGRHNALCYILEQNLHLYRWEVFAEMFAPPIRTNTVKSGVHILHRLPSTKTAHEDTRLASMISAALMRDFQGYRKSGGRWIAALCPFGHKRDYPGSHFYYAPHLGFAKCFGRHGVIPLDALRQVLRLEADGTSASSSS